MEFKNSLFYKSRPFEVPLIAIEAYSLLLENNDKPSEEEFHNVILEVLTTRCNVPNVTTSSIEYFLSRLESLQEDISLSDSASKPSIPNGKRGFGDYYFEYLQGLNLDAILMKMVGYDYSKAEYLYCHMDLRDTFKLIKEYLQGKSEFNRVMLEAILFGNGGDYSDNGSSVNWDANSEEGMNAMAAMGF